MAKEILCAIGVDVDAVAGWLGSYGGEDSPSDIQRGMFSGEVGTPRLLKLFDKLGAHGYSHENPMSMTQKQEEDVLVRCVDLIERTSGKKPRGYVAPWWEMS